MQQELKEREVVEKQLAAVKNELTACQKELKERDEKISGWWHLHVPRAWRPHSAAHPGPTRNRGGAGKWEHLIQTQRNPTAIRRANRNATARQP